jgi:hypothetical protein
MEPCNIKFGNLEESLQQQQDSNNNNNMAGEQVNNSRVEFGIHDDLNRNNIGAMSRSS